MRGAGARNGKRAVIAAACFIMMWSEVAPAMVQQVGASKVPDTDGDGVDDILEAVIDTDPAIADTDGDGCSDGIELARGSDPLVAANVPGPSFGQLTIGLVSRATSVPGYVRAISFIFLPAGYPDEELHMELVVLDAEAEFHVLDEAYLAGPVARRSIDFLPVEGDDVALLMVVGVNLSDVVIGDQDYMSAASVIWHGADTALEANGRDKDVDDGFWLQHAAGGPILFAMPYLVPGAGQGGSVVYQPIDPIHEPPSDWTVGEICHAHTTPVGYENGLIITRVIQADCEGTWDAYCSPSECSASAGDEYETVDPFALIGS